MADENAHILDQLGRSGLRYLAFVPACCGGKALIVVTSRDDSDAMLRWVDENHYSATVRIGSSS